MKAALQVAVGTYEIRNVPVPEIGESQCLIKVGACTVCATDAKYFKGLQTRAAHVALSCRRRLSALQRVCVTREGWAALTAETRSRLI